MISGVEAVRSARRKAIAFFAGFIGVIAVPSIMALACTDVSGNGDSILSLQFDTLASPSVVVGDTLRDTTGAISLPVAEIEAKAHQAISKLTQEIVVYCGGPT